jgi:hypothetical protein
MFKILRLRRQHCQIEKGNRVANKILDLSYFINSLRERADNKNQVYLRKKEERKK